MDDEFVPYCPWLRIPDIDAWEEYCSENDDGADVDDLEGFHWGMSL